MPKVGILIEKINKSRLNLTYRVFKKEGPKVLGYYTAKQRCCGAVQGFILTTSTQHLKKCIMILKYITLKFILRCFYLKRNLADIGFLALLWRIGSIKVPSIGLFYDPETLKY